MKSVTLIGIGLLLPLTVLGSSSKPGAKKAGYCGDEKIAIAVGQAVYSGQFPTGKMSKSTTYRAKKMSSSWLVIQSDPDALDGGACIGIAFEDCKVVRFSVQCDE